MKKHIKVMVSALLATTMVFSSVAAMPVFAESDLQPFAIVSTQDVAYIQPVAMQAVEQNGKNVISSDKYMNKEIVVKLDVSNIENTAGFNNYTFFVTYDPNVVEMTGVATDIDDDCFVTYSSVDNSTGDIVKSRFYNISYINSNISFTPSATNTDYQDVAADGATTCAKLGKVKFANVVDYVVDPDNSESIASVKSSGTLVALKFKVVGEGDTKLAVDVSSAAVNGLKNSYDDALTTQSLDGNISVGKVNVLAGDVNIDGELTRADAAIMLKQISGVLKDDSVVEIGDCDNNGKLDMKDVIYVLNNLN